MAVDPIISDLQYVMEANQELDILNFFKSFPITCKAIVERIDRDIVTIKVRPPGSVCLEAQEQTVILSRGLPEAVRARVVSFDLLSGLLKLDDFSYVGSHFGERMIARVQPEESIDIEMDVEGQQVIGQLADVSLSGIGVYSTSSIPQRGQMVQSTLTLPEGRITLPGKILNISEAPESQTRFSISFTRNAQEIAVIMRYIRDRRIEIIDEIERMYERSYHEKSQKLGPKPE
ncbi:MAG: PilZ domain-containing protein, partial [Anaerolineaceae bacterium]|nr:PilZ domain-containing protein [Anaerolineaceae bacterium]